MTRAGEQPLAHARGFHERYSPVKRNLSVARYFVRFSLFLAKKYISSKTHLPFGLAQ